jgi:DNA-binding transcriptional LysR family regulator
MPATMDIQHLSAFICVAEHASFSLAADHLNLTQPAISKRIAGLEHELGIALFDRSGRRPRLTHAGSTLLPRARSIARELQLAQQEVRDLADTVSGTLHLATSHHVGLHHLPPVLRSFADRYPNVRLQIAFTDSEKGYEAVQRGEIELAVITLAPQQPAVLEAQILWPDPLCFVVARNHPLVTSALNPGTPALQLCQLSQCANVLPGLDTHTGQIVKRLFDQHNLPLDTLMTTNYLETIKMMVNVGLGWSVLPQTLVDDELLRLPVDTAPLMRQLGYITHRKRPLSNAAKAFVELLQASADQSWQA